MTKNNLHIRHTINEDKPQLKELFAIARQFMSANGNPNQWAPNYPSDEQIQRDIDSGDSYVVTIDNQQIVATFVLRGGVDPTYNKIYEGAWLNDEPYATIHRIATNGKVKSVFNLAMHYALQQYENIRIDTHCENAIMRNAIVKKGFHYCGIIHCWNGDERLAYQYIKKTIV